MRRKQAVIGNIFDAFGSRYGSYISHYETINIPRFKHKKKPISMIKALEVRGRIERNKHLFKIIMHARPDEETGIVNVITPIYFGRGIQ